MKKKDVLYIIRVLEQLFGKDKLKEYSEYSYCCGYGGHKGKIEHLHWHIDLARAFMWQKINELNDETLAKIISHCGFAEQIGDPAIPRRTTLSQAYEREHTPGVPNTWTARIADGRTFLERGAFFSLVAVSWDLTIADYYKVRSA